MKKKFVICAITMFVSGFAFSQAQDMGIANTIYTRFGTAEGFALNRDPADIHFYGITNYFSLHMDLGKLVVAGNIALNINFADDAVPTLEKYNFNVIMQPIGALDIGVGTNLKWEVGPSPSYGPEYSVHDALYYAGLLEGVSGASQDDYHPKGAVEVKNYFANTSFAVRYAYEDFLQAGWALNVANDTFSAGLGVKLNILDVFTIGVAYNGLFKTDANNSVYIGSTISPTDTFFVDLWWNFVPNSLDTTKDGSNTIGTRFNFTKNSFHLRPEFSATFWSNKSYKPSMYAALDTYTPITRDIFVGLNASWGLGADYIEANGIDTTKAGTRLHINPYLHWSLNEINALSIGVNLMPVWWAKKSPNGTWQDFYWSIPLTWKLTF